MKNYIVITLGTSDVQVAKSRLAENGFEFENDGVVTKIKSIENPAFEFSVKANRNHSDTFLLNEARVDGEKLLDYGIEKLLPILEFPLVLPAIQHFFAENLGSQIHKCLFVFTDQLDERFRKNDTLYFATILKKILELKYSFSEDVFMEFPIHENVTDIDYQYITFAKECQSILETPIEEVKQVILFSQGGIDQINQALTLQLIQAYGTKLKLYQKAEGTEPKILEFPKLFLKDLNKQKILEHLDKYSFGLIDEKLTQNTVIKNLSRYASLRLELRYNNSKNDNNKLLKDLFYSVMAIPEVQQRLVRTGLLNYKDKWEESEKLEDLYISCKIAFHQKKFNEVLWKLFTINENLLKVEVDKLLNVDMSDFHRGNITPNRENTALVDFLNSKNPNYVSELRNNGIYLNNPSRFMYKKIIEIENTNSTYNLHSNISKLIEKLASNRNKIAHGLGFIDKDKISITRKDFKAMLTFKEELLSDDELPTLYQFDFQYVQEARVFGFLYKGIFYMVWYDRNHMIYNG